MAAPTPHATSDPTFFWHDYETFGKSPRRDRPSQFAGVRTDLDLNEVEAPLMLHCQPAPDYLPEPEACLLTGILPQTCLAEGVAEHAFADAIEAQLARPGTVGIGYNSIRFDDEVTRHLFWRNLIDPYAREWQNACGRWDLMDVVRTCYALRPDGIQWPTHRDGEMAGRPSFKLEHLTAANGIEHVGAHDALSDVRATLALARRVKRVQPKLWDFCLQRRGKQAVIAEIESAQRKGQPVLHISGMYGAERGCLALVWPLAPHPTNKNELIVWDLAEDPAPLATLNAEAIRARLFVKAADLPEGQTRLPIKTIHLNKSPVVIANLKVLSDAMAQRWGVDRAQAQRHAEAAAGLMPALAGLWADVFARATSGDEVDVDEDLYGGFVGNDDRRTLQRLRGQTPKQLAGREVVLNDPRLAELVFRWRARNFTNTLSDAERERWLEHCRARLHDGAGGAVSLQAYFERIDVLGEALDEDDERGQSILGALYEYAEQIAP
ncbi:MAG: exodeoxyribonuclease I [Leptothrix sp. (in: b-proteobacteria)]